MIKKTQLSAFKGKIPGMGDNLRRKGCRYCKRHRYRTVFTEHRTDEEVSFSERADGLPGDIPMAVSSNCTLLSGAFFDTFMAMRPEREEIPKGYLYGHTAGKRGNMETRLAVIAIIVENRESAGALNELLHEAGDYIVGRMGVPYREKKISVISVILDAPQNVISTLSGKLGMLPGVTSKTVYSKAEKHTKAEQG